MIRIELTDEQHELVIMALDRAACAWDNARGQENSHIDQNLTGLRNDALALKLIIAGAPSLY